MSLPSLPVLAERLRAEQKATFGYDRFAGFEAREHAEATGRFLARLHGSLEEAPWFSLDRKIDDVRGPDGLDRLFGH